MVTLKEIEETKSVELFNKARTLKYGLYTKGHLRRMAINTPFRQSIVDYNTSRPLAYSDSKEELDEYAKELGIHSFEITPSHCLVHRL